MKRTGLLILALAVLLSVTSVAYAATTITKFEMKFTNTDTYVAIASDTCSKDKTVANKDYATLKITSSSSTKNSKYYAYKGTTAISRDHFECTTVGTFMYYKEDLKKSTSVTLKGRPDSTVSSCTISGSFGAG